MEQTEGFPSVHLDVGPIDLPQCNYLDIANLTSYDWTNKFSVLLCNIRSCRKNFLDFTSYYDSILLNYSCIILVETWLTKEYEELFSLCGFRSFNVYRKNDGGGIRLYVRDTFNATILSPYTFITDICEMLCVEVTSECSKYILCCIYHPPTSDHVLNYDFIDLIFQKLVSIRDLGVPIVLAGDMNLNLFNPLKLNYITHYVNCLLELGLFPLITIPTKYNPDNVITKYALLDQIWVSSPSQVNDAYVVPIEIADHYSVAITIKYASVRPNNDRSKKVRIFNHTNNVQFTQLLNDLLPAIVDNDMNKTFESYNTNLLSIYDISYPIVIRTPISKTENGEWLTPAIKVCIKKKSKLYRMYMRGIIYKYSYTFYANKLTKLLNKAKKLYYCKLFLRDPKNSAKTWMHINRLIGNSVGGIMEKLKVGDRTLTGREMVNYANGYFVSIANSLTEGMPDDRPYKFYTPQNPYTFHFRPTDVGEVVKIIEKLKNKGNGLVDISVKTIKNTAHIFSVHIVLLYNFSIEKCVFPDMLKKARVMPGHKSGQKDLIDNFRPISNLPVVSKIFEKLTHQRIVSFVERYDLLSESQFGFRKGKNITLAALKLTTKIAEAYHNKSYAACFFLDLRKAFDIIDHSLLLKKLDHMGFRGYISQYLKSYFTNRKQHLEIGDLKSDDCLITKGVPQGSILGPVLFCLYINDIVKAVDSEVVLFADDAAFILEAPTLQGLYSKIKKLFSDLKVYLQASKLIPNLTKSKLMYFNSRPVPILQDIVFNGSVIEWVEEFKYLGLTLTNKMSFSSHIDNVVNRISRFVGTFYVLRAVLPESVLKMLYHSFVEPHVLLHIEIWGAAPTVYMKRLEIKINMLLRSILGVRYDSGRPVQDTASMYGQLGILKVYNVFKLRMFKLLVVLLNGSCPRFYDLLLRPYLSAHNYATRNSIFRSPLISCEVERRAVSNQLIRLENDIPAHFFDNINSKSPKSLVSGFRKYILSVQ